MQKRLNYIDIAKGIGIICVVLGHVTHDPLLRQYFYNFHMPLFFFISGVLLNTKLDITAHLKRRLKSIVVPYVIFFLVTYLYWVFVESRFRGSDLDPVSQFLSLPFGCGMEFNGPLWFLPCLFVVDFLSFVFVKRTNRKIYIISFILLAFFMGLVLQECVVYDLPWGLKSAMFGIVFYCLGYMSKELINNHIHQEKVPAFVIIALCLAIQLFTLNNTYGSMQNGSIGFVGIALIGILFILEISLFIRQSKYLEYIGSGSLIILALHGQLERIVIFVMSKLTHVEVESIRSNYLTAVAVTFLTILVICPIISIWNNTINKWIRKK